MCYSRKLFVTPKAFYVGHTVRHGIFITLDSTFCSSDMDSKALAGTIGESEGASLTVSSFHM